jgi:hypothetical protein
MKRWMIVGFAGGAALFGCPLVLAAAVQVDRPEEDWVAAVERYANSPGLSLPAGSPDDRGHAPRRARRAQRDPVDDGAAPARRSRAGE